MGRAKAMFSSSLSGAAIRLEMIEAMARADNWASLDECLAIKLKAAKIYSRYADAAFLVMQRVEERESATKSSDIN